MLTLIMVLGQIKGVFNAVRSRMKKVCDDMVPSLYSLYLPGTPSADEQKEHIAQRVETLLTKGAFTKDLIGGDFAHPAIFRITMELCYSPRKGLAHDHDSDFGPLFPLPYIALTFTCVSFTSMLWYSLTCCS